MAWHWVLENVEGEAIDVGSAPDFSTQSDAETWIGETWREWADAGAVQASLFEENRLVYGPMSLESE